MIKKMFLRAAILLVIGMLSFSVTPVTWAEDDMVNHSVQLSKYDTDKDGKLNDATEEEDFDFGSPFKNCVCDESACQVLLTQTCGVDGCPGCID